MRLLIGMDRSLSESQFLMPAALNLMPIPLLAMATMSDSDQDLVIDSDFPLENSQRTLKKL